MDSNLPDTPLSEIQVNNILDFPDQNHVSREYIGKYVDKLMKMLDIDAPFVSNGGDNIYDPFRNRCIKDTCRGAMVGDKNGLWSTCVFSSRGIRKEHFYSSILLF